LDGHVSSGCLEKFGSDCNHLASTAIYPLSLCQFPLMRQIKRNPGKINGVCIDMEDSRRIYYFFAQVLRAARIFAFVPILLALASAAAAQESRTDARPASQPQAIATSVSTASAPPTAQVRIEPTPQQATTKTSTDASNSAVKSKGDPGNPADDYKKSLNDLSALYERDVQRLEQENKQLQELYRDGLVARVELEASDKSVTAGRTKVEEIHKQISAANKPSAPGSPEALGAFAASDQAWTTGSTRVDGLIRYYGNKYGVDDYLIYCLMSQESRFSSNAISSKGAQGLMQLMPATAARYGVTNPYDVGQSIMGGTRYLKDLLQLFSGRVDLALAGYNAGENAVIKYGYTVPPYAETRNYVRLISARYTKKKATPLAPKI
jgi:soluble lytic murein transglycosylase-like protein